MNAIADARRIEKPASGAAAGVLRGTYLLFALGMIGNGVWMLAAPPGWWAAIPGVEHTGPLNPHLVRDFGVAYAVAGGVLAWCAANLRRARPAHLAVTALLAGHAAVHVAETLGGHLPPEHWAIDFPSVFAPALWLCILALPPVWRAATGAAR